MHYYQLNIGDFMCDTAHLTPLEECFYRRALDFYYLNEKPLPKETQSVFRRLRAITQEDKEAVLNVLEDFFVEENDGYHNKRCDAEILAYQQNANKNRENGKKGGRPPKNKANSSEAVNSNNPQETHSVNLGFENQTQNNPNQEPLTKNHKPITNNQEPFNNLKNKNGWLDFEKFETDFNNAYPDVDFGSIKSASWFEREKQAFEIYNAEKDLRDELMIYHFADWLLNAKAKYEKSDSKPSEVKNQKTGLSKKQISAFAIKLANHSEFASNHAPTGWTQEKFTNWVAEKLAESRYQQEWSPYLKQVGFNGELAS